MLHSQRQFNRIGLRIERLEERAMMTAVPAFSSLPGAPKTLYLDFDGDVQTSWRRTDANQTYVNIKSGEYNKDNVAGFNASEVADIKEIWQEVADDYSPFNINVTTVEPAASAFTTNQAMRVVIAGNVTATLKDAKDPTKSYNVSGDTFITNDNGKTLAGNSGYSSIESFTDSEPNVVYVFAKLIRKWSATDDEWHVRNFDQVIANTASHEAGHTFGLVHHTGVDGNGIKSDYDVGNYIWTPIMGDNAESDRTIWSKSTVTDAAGNKTIQDTVAKLTSVLGARPDDVPDVWQGAKSLAITTRTIIGQTVVNSGSSSGVITTLGDLDWYRFFSVGGKYQIDVDPTANGDLDAKLDVWIPVYIPSFNTTILASVGSADPSINWSQPFIGESASLSLNLGVGQYFVSVRSHGSYGDLGQYTVNVLQAKASTVTRSPALAQTAVTFELTPQYIRQSPIPNPSPLYVGLSSTQLASSRGAGQYVAPVRNSVASDMAFAAFNSSGGGSDGARLAIATAASDRSLTGLDRLPNALGRLASDLAFARG